MGRGISFEIGRPRSRGWKTVGRRWAKVVGGFENWTIFMDVICVSSLVAVKNIIFTFQKQSPEVVAKYILLK